MAKTQYADPAVSRAKFEREIAEFRALSDHHLKRGWVLARAEFPEVLVLLAAPKTTPVSLVMGVALDYSNYDSAPPSVRLVHPITSVPFTGAQLPTPLNRAMPPQVITMPGGPGAPPQQVQMPVNQALMQFHSPDDVPFLCLAGVREYHEHPAHSGDHWELHRASGAGRLVRLLDIIGRYGIDPIVGFSVSLTPAVGFGFGQAPP